MAANDDLPSIGGLIYALNQKPSAQPFVYAAVASGIWLGLGLGFGWLMIGSELTRARSVVDMLAVPGLLTALSTLLGPITLFWFLAMLAWRSDDLKLRSTAMAEVAVRLAEPDRMAEQQVASLGQSVRRQVSFMNEAVERALGRAGELEALVHNEVALLDSAYQENERKIRNLIQELAGERHALVTTSDRMGESLRAIGSEVPALIEKLSAQQLKLAQIIEGAGSNLTQLETAIATQTGNLDTALGTRTTEMQSLIEGYSSALNATLGQRAEQLHAVLQGHIDAVGQTLESGQLNLAEALDTRTEAMESSIADRTHALQVVFEEYARALDMTLANRAEALDMQLVERTRGLDQAFTDRLRLFDESVLRSTMAIDSSVGENARALTGAMEMHARTMSDTIARQAVDLDETLVNGITAVRRTSENITRQSIKAIEGLAGQADMLKSVSENLLTQINSVTNRFETQGQVIMRSANALETANYRIDQTLQSRQQELSTTLDRLSGRADELGRVVTGYSATIEGSLSDAEQRARRVAEELSQSTNERSRSALAEMERLRVETSGHANRALEDLRERFATVSQEMNARLGSMSSQFDQTSAEMRRRAELAATELEAEQARLRKQVEELPATARDSTDTMRRALQDQLRALEQLSTLTTREAQRRDVNPGTAPNAPLGLPPPGPQREPSRPLNSLTSTLAHELAQRPRPAPTAPPGFTPPASSAPARPAADPRDAWKLGDLLKRASDEPDVGGVDRSGAAGQQVGAASLNFESISRALDGATAATIWHRFRTGQRGFMIRSIYNEAGRTVFDEVSRRYHSEPATQQLVGHFLQEFETILRQTELRDPSGQAVQGQLVSDMGRAYLLLAHVAGRLV